MTKEELIEKMANSAGITKVAASVALEAFTGAITTSLKKGKRVTLTNFGTFTISKRKARMGRNPQTGEVLRIPAKTIPKFSPGRTLKEAVVQTKRFGSREPYGTGEGIPLVEAKIIGLNTPEPHGPGGGRPPLG